MFKAQTQSYSKNYAVQDFLLQRRLDGTFEIYFT